MEAYQRGVSEGPTTMTTSLEVQNIFGVASGCAEYCDAHTVVRSPARDSKHGPPTPRPRSPSLFWVRGLTIGPDRPSPSPILPSRSPGHPGGQRPEALRRQRAHRPLPRGRGNRDLVLRDEPRERRDARVRHQGTRRARRARARPRGPHRAGLARGVRRERRDQRARLLPRRQAPRARVHRPGASPQRPAIRRAGRRGGDVAAARGRGVDRVQPVQRPRPTRHARTGRSAERQPGGDDPRHRARVG